MVTGMWYILNVVHWFGCVGGVGEEDTVEMFNFFYSEATGLDSLVHSHHQKPLFPAQPSHVSRASQYKLVQLIRIYYFLIKDRVFKFCYRFECCVNEPSSIRTYINNLWFWKHVMIRNGDRSWAHPNFLLSKGKNLSRPDLTSLDTYQIQFQFEPLPTTLLA